MKKTLILTATLMLAACGGGVDESDLKEGIYDADNRICVPFQLAVQDRLPNEDPKQSEFGASEIKLLKRLENGKRANELASKQMEVLVRAGLYKADKEQRVGTGEQSARYAVYTLTESGNKDIRPHHDTSLLCVGKQKVTKINYHTDPTPYRGVVVTHVSYDAKIQMEKWASSLLSEKEYKYLANETNTQTATLMKTNKGWRDLRGLDSK